MKKIKPLDDKVLGRMIERMGETTTNKAGVIILEDQSSDQFLRPRWFEVTHTGPNQKDVFPGQFVLVTNGRWSRGIDLEGSHKEADKLFLIDNNEMLLVSENNPLDTRSTYN